MASFKYKRTFVLAYYIFFTIKVTILPSPGDHELGSSKLKITNIVNYGWEHRYHAGQLVAVHKGGVFFAYGVFAPGVYNNRFFCRLCTSRDQFSGLNKVFCGN